MWGPGFDDERPSSSAYIRELEDEVMEFRARLQAMTLEKNDYELQHKQAVKAATNLSNRLSSLEIERDMWKARADELAIEKVFGRVLG